VAPASKGTGSGMLRITVQDGPEALTFLVEGKLVGQWANELERSWRDAAYIRGHRALIVDLTETLFIDGEGRRILAKLFREGAFFRTAGPLTDSIVAEITGKSSHVLRGVLVPAMLLALIAAGAKAAQPEPLRLTLRDAVAMALKQNPEVQIANLNTAVDVANMGVDLARADLAHARNY